MAFTFCLSYLHLDTWGQGTRWFHIGLIGVLGWAGGSA